MKYERTKMMLYIYSRAQSLIWCFSVLRVSFVGFGCRAFNVMFDHETMITLAQWLPQVWQYGAQLHEAL